MFVNFFESNFFRTVKVYTIYLTFLNVPYFIEGLIGKSKITPGTVFAGSGNMITVQSDVFKWILDWVGTLLGQKGLSAGFFSWIAGVSSKQISLSLLAIIGVVLALLVLHLAIRLLGRFLPALSNLHAHHRPTPWSMLYLIIFIFYIVIYLTN